ncbi:MULTISPECIES: zinc-binding metallopeptidase family protein [Caproicibacterium]|uniref:M20/M25/M40 family metallo-hydrolase n=1 Tax=Caproicibacterium argilliputei TaxID=3030016 RepID=A0AA97DB13_9FIRM|nr:M20/M25/M40 family metallo-hydrolase [Caproicibacterium argilliputei]WOC32136.1 M20/M25/M40 family metallo-hydrolase [Caproicibacterium argilliputei]
MKVERILKTLCAAVGTSGDEAAPVREALGLTGLPDGQVDALGNGSVTLGAADARLHLLLEAHMDQVGMVVTSVEEHGFLHFANCGGADARVMPGCPVRVFASEAAQPLLGVVGSVPPHLNKDGTDKVPKTEDMTIDLGLPAAKVNVQVRPGDRVVPVYTPKMLLGTRMASAALDDRAGAAALVRCAQMLQKVALPGVKVTFLFSTREEVGGQGARTAAYTADAEQAICVDVSFAAQPGVKPEVSWKLGGGVMIGAAPILNRAMGRKLAALAQRESIPYKWDVMGGSTGTNCDEVAVARGGVQTALLSIPERSMHTPAEVVDLQDVEDTARLMAVYVCDLCGAKLPEEPEEKPAMQEIFSSTGAVSTDTDAQIWSGCLPKLCTARGISGAEDAVRELILSYIRPYAEKIEITPLGSVLAYKKGRSRARTRLLLNAHMDEVGLIVTHITDEGLLKFAAVGGIDPRILPGRSVTVGYGSETVPGVIGLKPIHLTEKGERQKSIPMDDLYIDIGAKDKAEAAAVVTPGDMVTFDSVYEENGCSVKSRALDDRAGCALLIHLMQQEDWAYDTVFEFAVQEEVGLNGSRTGAFLAEPQAAIVVESTTAADVPGTEKERQMCRLGEGPVISFMDRRTIYDKEYTQWAFEEAQKAGVPCQWKEGVAGGNDAGAIHGSRGGVRTVAVSLACRYLHAPMGVISKEDYDAAAVLLQRLAERIAGSE